MIDIDNLVKLFVAASVFVATIAGLVFGYIQWRGGKRYTEISETARNLIGASSDVLNMKQSEIDSLRRENNQWRSGFQYVINYVHDPTVLQQAWSIVQGDNHDSKN